MRKEQFLGMAKEILGNEGDRSAALPGRVQSMKGRARCWNVPGPNTSLPLLLPCDTAVTKCRWQGGAAPLGRS